MSIGLYTPLDKDDMKTKGDIILSLSITVLYCRVYSTVSVL